MTSFYDCRKTTIKYGYEAEYFWVTGILLVIVGFLGLLGNLINLVILCHKELRSKIFYNLLAALAFFDALFIASYGIDWSYTSLACQPTNDNVYYVMRFFSDIGGSGSIYTTIVVSLERLNRILKPRISSRPNVCMYIVPILTLIVTFNFPAFLDIGYLIANGTGNSSSMPEWTESTAYHYYEWWTSILFYTAVPLILLIVVNAAIIFKMYQLKKLRKAAFPTHRRRLVSIRILLTVVLVFLVSHFLLILQQFLYYFASEEHYFHWNFITPIASFCILINSSVNFIIYSVLNKKFRLIFYQMFKLKRCISSNIDNYPLSKTKDEFGTEYILKY